MIFPTLPGGWIRLVLWRHLLSVKSLDSFVAQVGRCEMNEAEESREKKDCLVSEVGGCHSGELDFIPDSDKKIVWGTASALNQGCYFQTWKKKIDLPIAQIWILVPSQTSLLQPSFYWPSYFVLALESILVSWVPSIPCQHLGLYFTGSLALPKLRTGQMFPREVRVQTVHCNQWRIITSLMIFSSSSVK